MPSPWQNLHLVVKFTSLSAVVDNPSTHFDFSTPSTASSASDAADLVNHVIAKMNAIPTGGIHAPTTWLSVVISRAANSGLIDVYDVSNHLDGSRAGSPVLLTAFTPGPTMTGGPMPEGVASVITLQAPYGTDVEFGPGTRPRARDRGRIYWGPLTFSATKAETATNRCMFDPVYANDMLQFIKSIYVYTTTPNSVVYNLAVWSRKGAAMKALQEAWMDDRPDYVRLRADQGASRTVMPLP